MSDQLRVAVVGVGRMGRIHARLVSDADDLDLVAVADADPVVAAHVAEQLGSEPTDPAGLVDRDDVDAWVVATPTITHHRVVSAALEAGVHVLCEKPLTLDPAADLALGAAAREVGRILQIGYWRRFSPPWRSAKELVDAGAIGRPLYLRLSQWDADPPSPEFCRPEASGGLAIDCGVHEFDLAEWLTGGTVQAATGFGLPLVDPGIGGVGDVDNLLAVLDLSTGARATVDLSRNCRYGDDVRTEILGDDGAIFVEMFPTGRTRLATAAGVETVAGSEVDDAMAAGLIAQADAFRRRIAGEQIEHPGADASRRTIEIGRAVQASISSGHPVPVE